VALTLPLTNAKMAPPAPNPAKRASVYDHVSYLMVRTDKVTALKRHARSEDCLSKPAKRGTRRSLRAVRYRQPGI
jgi:hypothetical protein